jgi:MFS family permease
MDTQKTLKDNAAMRWLVLVLVSGMFFSTYWFYDFMGPLKGLMLRELDLTSSQFGMIISVTTFANTWLFMIIVGGIFLDRFGIRPASVVFGLLTTAGAGLVAMGTSGVVAGAAVVWVMAAGRVLFGSGIEICCVVISRTVVKWFKGYELALAMAVNVAFGRLGSALAVAFSRDIAGDSLARAVNFSALLMIGGFAMLMVYLIFDVRIDRQIQATGEADEPFRLKDLTDLISNPSFIFIALLCVTFYSAVFPFIQYAPDLLINKFGFSSKLPSTEGLGFVETLKVWITNGPKVTSLIPLGTILFTPIFGTFIDRRGKAATIMILGGVLLIFAHLSLSLFNSVALGYAGLLCLGVAFSLVPSAMWPAVAKIVPESRLGTAYATMFTIQNWGLMLFFWLPGKVLDITNADKLEAIKAGQATFDYTVPVLLFVALGAISIFLAFLLKAADRRQRYGLELPSNASAE